MNCTEKRKIQKILIGLAETCGNIFSYAKGLKKLGYSVDTVIINKEFYTQKNEYTYVIEEHNCFKKIRFIRYFYRRWLLFYFFIKALCQYDYFIYIWHATYLPLKLDMLVLKLLRRKFCVVFCGSDVRYFPLHVEIEEQYFGIKRFSPQDKTCLCQRYGMRALFLSLYHTSWTFWLTKNIFSMRNQSTFFMRKYFQLFLPVDFEKMDSIKADEISNWENPIRIIHAPSNLQIKNTAYIEKVILSFCQAHPEVNYIRLTDKSNEEVIRFLKTSEIVVDQLGTWPALLALEAMYCNCVVFTGRAQTYENLTLQVPVFPLTLNEDQFLSNLSRAIDKKIGNAMANDAHRFVTKYYNLTVASQRLIDAMDGKIQADQTPLCKKADVLKLAKNKWQYYLIRLLLKN